MSDESITSVKEIRKSFSLSNYFTKSIGLSFTDEPKNFLEELKINMVFFISMFLLSSLVLGDLAYVFNVMINSLSLEEFVFSWYNTGYAVMSWFKCIAIWHKRNLFRNLIKELAVIWPVSGEDEEANEIKRKSLSALRVGQMWYTFFNVLGVWFYNLTPIALHVYRLCRGSPSDLGYVWHVTYPFDKTKPVVHEFVYIFEVWSGVVSVWCMLGSDMLFTTMASHITMLLRLLQLRIRNITNYTSSNVKGKDGSINDCYDEIVSIVKLHQRLITYHKHLEEAFSLVNLINIRLSSINICCVVFSIVIFESWMQLSSKFYLGAALTQVGILCWYADNIYKESLGVADAVYESGWYKTNARCRRALLFVLKRSQKPLYFTALKFGNITMVMYNSILTTAYSYFALLYTVYHQDQKL